MCSATQYVAARQIMQFSIRGENIVLISYIYALPNMYAESEITLVVSARGVLYVIHIYCRCSIRQILLSLFHLQTLGCLRLCSATCNITSTRLRCCIFKRYIHQKIKIQLLCTHPYASRKLGEVS